MQQTAKTKRKEIYGHGSSDPYVRVFLLEEPSKSERTKLSGPFESHAGFCKHVVFLENNALFILCFPALIFSLLAAQEEKKPPRRTTKEFIHSKFNL
ncbi:hypothetical protein NECAME_11772 [Necator americanus]|uniref:Uncharacterized protein n=1 Tax=Necator americanus TaxID=51031 RepID=W2T428_NECAM|nr:hypothetical protein NECAME_11772 [Necator americanus]ETN76294.1 hypothetical protein NECAME_11772 [Necator americanus]